MWNLYKLLQDNFLDETKNYIKSLDDKIGTLNSKNEVKAIPKSNMKVAGIIEGNQIVSSVGVDGNIYRVPRLAYSEDAGETWVESTYNFDTTYGSPIFLTKTQSGYVVVCRDVSNRTGAIYFSEDFNSGYEAKVICTPDSYPEIFSIGFYNGTLQGEQVVLVGEYGQVPSEPKKLHGTFDGGKTWNVLFEMEIVNPEQNAHIHTAHYDKYTGRIYVATGDHDNAGLFYSDDKGVSWTEIPVPENNIGKTRFQPTQIISTPTKLIIGPDSDPIPVSVLSLPFKTYTSYGAGAEVFDELRLEHTVVNKQAFTHYPISHIMTDNGEIYIVYKGSSGDNQTFVVASGDNGLSWHTVFSLKGNSNKEFIFDRGIVGIDKHGFIYGRQAYEVDGVQTLQTVKFTPVKWERF